MVELLNRRLIFVTGKGGVGKSTVAHALGLVAARRGKRVIVAELAAPGSGAGIREVQLAPGLFHIVIDPQAAMEEYLRHKAGSVGGALSSSRLFGALAMATPGLRELLGMGKIWELAQSERRSPTGTTYDLVVVDAPATGHGVAALRTPRVFADTARVGPVANTASAIAATLADRSFTALVAVTLAEEMPVRETLSLAETVGEDGLELDAVVLNARYPERYSSSELERVRAAARDLGEGPAAHALAVAASAATQARDQTPHVDRLAEHFSERLLSLPFLYCDQLGEPELAVLADQLGDALT